MIRRLSRLVLHVGIAFAFPLSCCSCGERKDKVEADSDVLLVSGESVLTLSDVVRRIPVGLEPADSAALFQLIIDNWIKTKVLSELAERKLPDVSRIENKVEEYRNRLIVSEYLKEMKKGKEFKINSDTIREFYNRYKAEMLTESPLVRGIYLKVATNMQGIDDVRKLVFCGDDNCIDILEKTWLDDAIQYDYFMNDWVDWQMIADQIPYRFYDPDAFLKSTGNFETTYNGSTYFLHISDYLPTGSQTPYEFAALQIQELMERRDMKSYEDALVKSLVEKALRDGELVAEGYDPVRKILTLGEAITRRED